MPHQPSEVVSLNGLPDPQITLMLKAKYEVSLGDFIVSGKFSFYLWAQFNTLDTFLNRLKILMMYTLKKSPTRHGT